VIRAWKDILARREMLWNLVSRNLKIRYKNSFLGFFWTILNPTLMALVYAVFIKGILRFRAVSLSEILVGVFAWQFLVQTVSDCMNAVVGNTSLIKKIYFPRLILPLSTVLANFVNFLLSLAVLVVALPFLGAIPSWRWLWIPLLALLHLALCGGLAFLVSCSNVFFRDTEHLIGILLTSWFFLTPVMYTLQVFGDHPGRSLLVRWYLVNPMATLIILYRWAFGLGGSTAGFAPSLWAGGLLCLGLLVAGQAVFRHFEGRFADIL